ncbi:MAG: xanthine dehydrogenase family protein molybdopterin-binding subunit [Deltaproteobacteria bacterium]|jgi:isoquinoline 1-oxidoreductase beta subunit|nr:xanthine dehydrogenase family protein molybdopterin-binding subunit [Deltaproteobacteria bacterium]
MKTDMTRRDFLKKSSLVVAVTAISGELQLFNASPVIAGTDTSFKPHAFVEIATDDTVTVWVGQSNLGQGSQTGIAMIVAEELDADWPKIQVKMAPAAEPFKNPFWHAQVTGGSTSIRHRWDLIRKAGAAARQMLIAAAAKEWGIDAEKCNTDKGRVINPDGRSLGYGKLVPKAQEHPVPENPPFKNAKDYRIIGSSRDRLDIPAKVAGTAVYGIDMQLPDMVIAVVARPPYYGVSPESYDRKAAMAVKGVVDVMELENRVAVCATTTYAALQGRKKLNIKWTKSPYPQLNDETLDEAFTAHLVKAGVAAESVGDAAGALAKASVRIEASYKFPYISHAQLEPINCTAQVEKDRCRVWVPTQGQTAAQDAAAKITGLPPDKIEVMTTYVGGGFGLRVETDPVVDAVSLAKILQRPVKVMWTREDDFANDYFRPGSVSKIQGGLDESGKVVAWSHKVASPSIMTRSMPEFVENNIDPSSLHGIPDMPYKLQNRLMEYVMMDLPIPVGFWRSVGYAINVFAIETFMDELAYKAKKDPVQFRLDLMEKDSRPYSALSLLAEKTGWEGSAPADRSRGVAVGTCFGSSAAHMAEVSVDRKTGKVKVHKLVCTIDCGPAVYPDAITAQVEGAAIMALSVAFHEKVHFSKGGVKTANFDEYPILTMSGVPEIEVYIAKSHHEIGGVGEPGLPTVAPAVANAVFRATGVRLRELPFNTGLLKKG